MQPTEVLATYVAHQIVATIFSTSVWDLSQGWVLTAIQLEVSYKLSLSYKLCLG